MAPIADIPATRNKVKEQYCAARWREAGWVPLQCLQKPPRMARALSKLSRSMQGKFASRFQPRVSNDSPKLNAFCRVAPSVRFKVRAMLAARTFFFA
jgi:hypothetical protein